MEVFRFSNAIKFAFISIVFFILSFTNLAYSNSPAQADYLFERGRLCIIDGDFNRAVQYLRESAEIGSAYAQFVLALCYADGKGVERNYAEAFKWMKRAAESGNADASWNADAQFFLAGCYADGKGVERNYAEAFKWFKRAAESGNANAQLHLALCYAEGNGVECNDAEAFKWFKRAAESGNADAQFGVALS